MIAKLKALNVIILSVLLLSFGAAGAAENWTCSTDECGSLIEGFERYANYGHVDSMVLLAVAYATGEGVEQSDEQANFWMKEALRNRSAMAAYVKANWRREGLVYEQDFERAEWLMERAINGGHPIAMYDRAVNLLRENRDIPEALELLELAQEKHLPEANYLMARLLEEGQFYEQDIVAAGLIYRDLAVQRFKDSRSRLNRIVREIEVADEFTSPIVEATETAEETSISRETVLSQLREYNDMEVITITGRHESFEDQLLFIQQHLRRTVQKNSSTRFRRMRPCGAPGSGCQVVFDRKSSAQSPYNSVSEMLGMQ